MALPSRARRRRAGSAGGVRELVRCEHEGDRITHDIIHRLDGGRPRSLGPALDSAEGHRLATALDDIVDHAEEAADQLVLDGIEAPMEQAVEIADVLVVACEQVAVALRCVRVGVDLAPRLVEIHRLENEGDRLRRDAVASLSRAGSTRWSRSGKDVHDALETRSTPARRSPTSARASRCGDGSPASPDPSRFAEAYRAILGSVSDDVLQLRGDNEVVVRHRRPPRGTAQDAFEREHAARVLEVGGAQVDAQERGRPGARWRAG
jgi:hypothetical protein